MNSPLWLPSPLAPLTAVERRTSPDALQWLTSRDLVAAATWEVYRAADLPSTPALRAASLATWVVADGALSHESALWVHLGGTPPALVHVTSPRALRNARPQRRFYCAQIPVTEAQEVGTTRVTTRIRTACDLARRMPPHGSTTALDTFTRVQRIAALLDAPGELEEARSYLERLHRQPGRPAAKTLFSQIAEWRSAGLL